ncbi:MAG: Uma2 family endonuclease [Acidobacteria bacterium]|nr:Uma2 family endonuclease [Acidobacteriota bacterium]
MSTLTTNYLDIIERLPAGAKLELQNIDWDEYEHLLTQMESFHPGHRLSYDRGRLIIVGPSPEHEHYKEFIIRFVQTLSDEMDITVESWGGTTFMRKALKKGVEPDTCFFVQNAASVIGRRNFPRREYPPPDVVVEIDMSHDSLDKFHIYATLGVPEIWRYDGENTRFYKLTGESYEVIQNSRAFPTLRAKVITQYLELSKTDGHTAALKAFRQMLRSRASS